MAGAGRRHLKLRLRSAGCCGEPTRDSKFHSRPFRFSRVGLTFCESFRFAPAKQIQYSNTTFPPKPPLQILLFYPPTPAAPSPPASIDQSISCFLAMDLHIPQIVENATSSTATAPVALSCSALGVSFDKPCIKLQKCRRRVPLEDITHLFLNLLTPPIGASSYLAPPRQAINDGRPCERRAHNARDSGVSLRKGFR
ncbi:hypothetical protein OPV22_031450 [Ensete ventricosum]|uniref:Uncharacterized protein n=1 Tax=Ensete ventricosum TaxID=4639 RepID=A0AAV8PP20_ENSVE|nr:hypothetical protein OPV22_031450 [Ensete ventricosum]